MSCATGTSVEESPSPHKPSPSTPGRGGMQHTSKTSGGRHPSGLPQARWDWPFKTTAELTVTARWFRKQAHAQRGQGDDALF